MDLAMFPSTLREKAKVLAGEPAWPGDAAREVVNFLRAAGYAVVGVELWQPEGDMPRVLGWSEYIIDFSRDWKQYVELNADQAIEVIKGKIPENCLFNFTWLCQDEIQQK